MLTSQQIDIVKATVPVLQVHGEAITQTFYRNLFNDYPSLKDVFNMANQAKGAQPRSLAASVLTYAANIDQLQSLGPAVKLIAHKHCSLDVAPEHYPIVGTQLLRAIGEVLGDAVTPEIVDAWSAAYAQLAEIMIGVEGSIYEENAVRGWTGFKPFRVVAKQVESETITSFVLAPVDGQPLAAHLPGQYVAVKIEGRFENTEIRQYTVASAPNGVTYRIAVKREPGGKVSNYLHDELVQGDEILVHMPQGEFVLDEASDAPVVLLCGGVGLTPMYAMLDQLTRTASTREILWIHATRNGREHAFGSLVRELTAKFPNLTSIVAYEQPLHTDVRGMDYDVCGRLEESLLEMSVPQSAEVYICGPVGFMRAMDNALERHGIPTERRRYEVFGPTLGAMEAEAVLA